MIPTLVGISLLLWLMMVAAPGRPGETVQAMGDANTSADPTKERSKGESQRLFRRHYGLDRPVLWNGWTTLDVHDVEVAVENAERSLDSGESARTKREARERLEDWGEYAVPALVTL